MVFRLFSRFIRGRIVGAKGRPFLNSRLGGSGGGRSSGCSSVRMVRNAEGQWEDCRDNYIAACRAASAALRFREAFEDGGVGGKL